MHNLYYSGHNCKQFKLLHKQYYITPWELANLGQPRVYNKDKYQPNYTLAP